MRKRKAYYYLKVRFKEKYQGRNVWFFNDSYLCDCINQPFISKENCQEWIERLKKRYKDNIEQITLHKTYR